MSYILLFWCDYSNHIKNIGCIVYCDFKDMLSGSVYFAINGESSLVALFGIQKAYTFVQTPHIALSSYY